MLRHKIECSADDDEGPSNGPTATSEPVVVAGGAGDANRIFQRNRIYLPSPPLFALTFRMHSQPFQRDGERHAAGGPINLSTPDRARQPHLQTLLPAVIRHIPPLPWFRERLELEDGDFLDLDWLNPGQGRLLILSHGLEGHSRRPYVAGLARAAARRNWSVLAWNFRGCSGNSIACRGFTTAGLPRTSLRS